MVASDNMTNTAHVTKGFQVLDHTSVEPQPELVATEQKAVSRETERKRRCCASSTKRMETGA
jgi:hypothetical protein